MKDSVFSHTWIYAHMTPSIQTHFHLPTLLLFEPPKNGQGRIYRLPIITKQQQRHSIRYATTQPRLHNIFLSVHRERERELFWPLILLSYHKLPVFFLILSISNSKRSGCVQIVNDWASAQVPSILLGGMVGDLWGSLLHCHRTWLWETNNRTHTQNRAREYTIPYTGEGSVWRTMAKYQFPYFA